MMWHRCQIIGTQMSDIGTRMSDISTRLSDIISDIKILYIGRRRYSNSVVIMSQIATHIKNIAVFYSRITHS